MMEDTGGEMNFPKWLHVYLWLSAFVITLETILLVGLWCDYSALRIACEAGLLHR